MKLLLKQFNEQTVDIVDTAYQIEDAYTSQANKCITEVRNLLDNTKLLTNDQLMHYIVEIPIIIYDLTDVIQELSVKNDSAKMQRKKVFNDTYLEQTGGTVAHKTSIAQQACEREQFIENIFSKVYKQCERKIEILEMLHTSLKKILNWRESEMELSRTSMLQNGKSYI